MKRITILLLLNITVTTGLWAQVPLRIIINDGVSLPSSVEMKNSFVTKELAKQYALQLLKNLSELGYAAASLDSIKTDADSVRAYIFLGKKYIWQSLRTEQVDRSILEAVNWYPYLFEGTPYNKTFVEGKVNELVDHLENNGYPFAKVWIDSVQMNDTKVSASLHVVKGGIYTLDSIYIIGRAPVSNRFLQQYLELSVGSPYSQRRIDAIQSKLQRLTYLEITTPPRLRWLSKGYVVELSLAPLKTNRFNLLLGFLPNTNTQSANKLLITGDASLLLNNELGMGESFSFVWQRLQAASPRIQFLFTQPYIFKLPVGVDLSFNMYKRESSFLNVDMKAGSVFYLGHNQRGTVSIQRFISQSSFVDTASVILYKTLPAINNMNRSTLGLEYEVNTTNYIPNPVRGSFLKTNLLIGSRRIKKSDNILKLKDPLDPSFNFNKLYDSVKLTSSMAQMQVQAGHYFPLGRHERSTIKTSVAGALYLSDMIFRNEMFQIGGYKLLRGFDDESQFLSQYAIGTVEYRYLVGERSFFFIFMDGGFGADKSYKNNIHYTYASTGMGISFETKTGLFNLAWAIGKRNDEPFNLRKSKIHIGFTNTF